METEYSKSRLREKTYFKKKFLPSWEHIPEFKSWLKPSNKGIYFYYCTACNYDGKGGLSEIKRHSTSAGHTTKLNAVKMQTSVADCFSSRQSLNLENSVKEAEILIAGFVVEHNLPFTIMPHLIKLIKRLNQSSPNPIPKLNCGKTKATMLIKNVMGAERKENLVEFLKQHKFSLLLDESTDITSVKTLAIVVRIVRDDITVEDLLLSLIELEDATAQNMYQEVVNVFISQGIPYKENLVGLATDGANVMAGENHSLYSMLKADCPDLFFLKCVPHSFHLCASYACKQLPYYLEELARGIYNYVSCSPKRIGELRAFQELWGLKPHKMLHPAITRWLSLQKCISRILEHYIPLKGYFLVESQSNKSMSAQNISRWLNDPITKVYFEFLDYILPFFNNINLEMQSEEIRIHILYMRVEACIKSILEHFIKQQYLQGSIIDLDFKNTLYFLPLTEVYFGGKVCALLMENQANISEDSIMDFKQNCLNFLIEAVTQISKRFPLKSLDCLKQMSLLNPSKLKEFATVVPLALHFKNVISSSELNNLDIEYRSLRNMEELSKEHSIVQFWKTIGKIKKGDDTPMFPTIIKLIKHIFCLPHSSASVERIFSQINLNKSKVRNRLCTKTLEGLLHAKTLFKNNSCFDVSTNSAQIRKVTQNMYDHTRIFEDEDV